LAVDVAQRQRVDLRLHLAPQLEHEALDHAREHVAGDDRQDRRRRVELDRRPQRTDSAATARERPAHTFHINCPVAIPSSEP